MDLTKCSECDKLLGDDTVWYRPFAAAVPDGPDPRIGDFVSIASTAPVSGQEIPFHPACYEKRTGQKAPTSK